MMTILSQGIMAFAWRISSNPSRKGIRMSVRTISGIRSCIMDRAISPSDASPHSAYGPGMFSITLRMLCRINSSSSTTNT